MSYLNPLRLHFAGQFQANVSTVNNDPGHFDNGSFQPGYQYLQGPGMNPPNGWFNPQGDASFRLLGCKVTAAWMPSGQVSASDPVSICVIADADTRVPAKMVDLDPEQQMVSEIWGLTVRIADASGTTLMQGDFDPAAFTDIWARGTGNGSGGDANACAAYQSVLDNLHWGDVRSSPFLTALQASATDGLLSIKFNVDGMNLNFKSADFMCGRIVGSIGPASASEPRHFVAGRQFMASSISQGFFVPQGGINFFTGRVDAGTGSILLDLGNALSTTVAGGPVNTLGDLTLAVQQGAVMVPLGTLPATGPGGYAQSPDWYAQTAGVVALPLTPGQIALIADAALTLS
ncbi:MAG: hypothetical protein RL367_2888, partial [Pseudomonadota bacterium]